MIATLFIVAIVAAYLIGHAMGESEGVTAAKYIDAYVESQPYLKDMKKRMGL